MMSLGEPTTTIAILIECLLCAKLCCYYSNFVLEETKT